MAIRSLRVLSAYLGRGAANRPAANVNRTLCITLAPKDGVTPSDKPPVRIFLGTESAQFRAERAFVWSIERVRDPARCYEIHLMKDLAGFERRLWLTGFTNYRFAIPDLAGRSGRAIYNDADQIYLRDPAQLFDLSMGDAGLLSINDRDTSVMLIDCEKMAPLWNNDSARATRNRDLEARMREAELWADLDNGWNARDAEYDADTSHLIHYTTIHAQPWRPQPRDYVYRGNPARDIWMTIEAEADEADFLLFTADEPSPGFAETVARGFEPIRDPARLTDFSRGVTDAEARSVAYYGVDSSSAITAATEGLEPRINSLAALADADDESCSDVVFVDGLDQLPDLDLPWVLDQLFARAGRVLVVAIRLDESAGRSAPADPVWWYQQMTAAGQRRPHCQWRLVARQSNRVWPDRVWRWSGGPGLAERPRTWVLCHYKRGHHSQVLGVADALGWPYEVRDIKKRLPAYLAGLLAEQFGVTVKRLPGNIEAPWPDLVIASGWLPGLVAWWINARNHGLTRLVVLGRRGGRVGESQNIAVVCRHFQLPPHPRQIETVLPPNKAAAERLAEARARWPNLYGDGDGPKVAMLMGGDSVQSELTAATAADLGRKVQTAADAVAGRLAVLTSRRTRPEANRALVETLSTQTRFEPWRRQPDGNNPYLGYLADADILVVTGESESMLAEAVATGKPVYIMDLPDRAPGLRRKIADWVVAQANTDRFNARGSRRPQQGLQYVCARLVDRRVFVPRRDMGALHHALIEHGVARRFEAVIEHWTPTPWHETEALAGRIRQLLGVSDTAVDAGDAPVDTKRAAAYG